MKRQQERVSGWGKYPVIDGVVVSPESATALQSDWQKLPHFKLPVGARRSYGDAALLGSGAMLDLLPLNQILSFEDGILTCEAGCTLAEILTYAVPKGWFLPVTPGTKYITVGGALASDVHGKNHHFCGALSNFVLSIEVLTASGEVLHCSRLQHKDLFWATLAGYGLTGVILQASFRLEKIPSAFIHQQTYKVQNLAEAFYLLTQKEADFPFSVAWLDCLAKGEHLGRSLVMFGKWATAEHLPDAKRFKCHKAPHLVLPERFPSAFLQKWGVKSFNTAYYHKQQKAVKSALTHYNPYFYPLDGIQDWNRMYGKKGFIQYQFVLPEASALIGMRAILERIAAKGWGSFLVVLKKFGAADIPYLSFAQRGFTLALDFKMQDGLLPFLQELDQMVIAHGGRNYLTKDSTMTADSFREMYPNWEKWRLVKDKFDPHHQFQSALSKRLAWFD